MRDRRPASILLAFAALVPLAARGQSAPAAEASPCATPEHRQLDFWVGSWEVSLPEGRQVGRSDVSPVFSGCAIEERWSGEGIEGGSLNAYDKGKGKWHQTWADQTGRLVLLEGGLTGGRMVLEGAPAGASWRTRMTYEPIAGGRVRQTIERSESGGWKKVYEAIYSPRKPASEELSAVARAYAAAWTANDAEAVMRLFAEDAVILPAHAGNPRVGHREMRQFWWPTGGKPTRVLGMDLEPDEASASDDFGTLRGRFVLAWKFEGETQERRSSGRFLMTLAKGTDRTWKITRYMWDDHIPR
jgi:uncharacterized protein (TIGR02246 family)